jgi:nucleotide-binding universal stress UspA family protein
MFAMYKKILLPLDGSELAECALSHVKNLTKGCFVAEVTILNVFCGHIIEFGQGHGNAGCDDSTERARDGSRKYLADVESRLGSEGIKVKTESMEGYRPAEIISYYAQRNDMDLIIIATHGYTGMKKLMFGSVALEVLHSSHVPVLLIRPEPCRA